MGATRNGRRRRWFNPSIIGNAIEAANQVAKYARKRKGDSYTTTNKRRKSTTYNGVTQQHDEKLQYRKSYMPKRKRVAWKKFCNKVKAVADKDRGVCTWTYNYTISPTYISTDTTLGVNVQNVSCVHFYGLGGTPNANELGSGDINQIIGQDDKLRTSLQSDKILMHSAVLDLTITNVNPGVMEVDVYEIDYMKSCPSFTNFLAFMNDCVTNYSQDPRAGGSVPNLRNQIQYRGVTPFEMGTAISAMRFKIVSKKKYFIGAGQCITRQVRDPRNRFINLEYAKTKTGLVYPGLTKTFLIVGKPTYVTIPTETTILKVGATRTFKYTIEGIAEERSEYING